MTTYAIGDVRGDLQTLQQLLERIQFDKEQDTLWFIGNLVNGGPDSLGVLRFVKDLGKYAVTVLGDQELRLLGIAEGRIPETRMMVSMTLSTPLGSAKKGSAKKLISINVA